MLESRNFFGMSSACDQQAQSQMQAVPLPEADRDRSLLRQALETLHCRVMAFDALITTFESKLRPVTRPYIEPPSGSDRKEEKMVPARAPLELLLEEEISLLYKQELRLVKLLEQLIL
jgi:hypothetical protein